ncbi:MAG: MoxR family ATPase [Oscillospiraceae bacterium]|nr:MoxR family ATPase [Oscillospiraceae bacterium]MBQ9373196.1 MoxR family ATPase [Oscillospiraceae bacterium]
MNLIQRIINELRKAVQGKDQVLIWVLMTILARGNILLEDIPGVGKTNMALAFSRALGLDYGRVQFNPDVLPSDITGYSVYQKETGKMIYQKGAILCNLFLADELNRATSRTQSALLEAMEEGQVTVDGVSHPLPRPFTVIATQNPTGAAGTQLLPDSQMDRFTVRLSVGYPQPKDELDMVLARQGGVNPLNAVRQVVTAAELVSMQEAVGKIYMKESLIAYVVSLVSATRQHPQISRGASPRATLAIVSMAKATAYMNGRDYVLPEDVQTVFVGTVSHRLLLSNEAQNLGLTENAVLTELMSKISAPKV